MPSDLPDLASLPDVGQLPEETVKSLQDAGRTVHIPAGWTPIHQSEPADEAYLILEGHVAVVRGDAVVAQLGPGSLAGEMGLVDHRLRNARITASEPVVALAWPKDDFQRLRGSHREFDRLVRHVTRERHHANDAGADED